MRVQSITRAHDGLLTGVFWGLVFTLAGALTLLVVARSMGVLA